MEEYQRSEMSGQLAELLKDPVLAIAMMVADGAAPVNGGARVAELPHVAHIQHGIDRGYAMYPRILKLLATAPTGGGPVEPTYQAPEEEKE